MRLPDLSERQSKGGLSARPQPQSGVITRTLMRRAIPLAVGGALLLFVAAGCGGGNGNSNPVPTPTPIPTPAPPFTARFVIDWDARSRAIKGLSSSLSARFTLFAANPDTPSSDLVFTVNRPTAPSATSQSYPTPSAIRREWGGVMTVEFFSQPDGAGTKMGTAFANANLAGTGQDGTVPAFALGPNTAVASVSVLPGTLPLGASTQLLFSAKDSNGVNIALTPGSVFFTLANATDSSFVTLTPDGIGTPIGTAPASLATVNVIATVDGKASAALGIPVVSNGTLTIAPTTADKPELSFELPLQFAASITGLPAGASTAVSYRVGTAAGDPDTSGNSGTVTSAGLYTAPRLAGTFSVTAFSLYDPSKTATTLVKVFSKVAVVITPTNAGNPGALDVVINNTVSFNAAVSSIPARRDAGVNWSIVDAAGAEILDGSGGMITKDGVYKAPGTRGTTFVQAVSRYDTTKKSILKINILAGKLPVTVQ